MTDIGMIRKHSVLVEQSVSGSSHMANNITKPTKGDMK
jgi:hypothetical protein